MRTRRLLLVVVSMVTLLLAIAPLAVAAPSKPGVVRERTWMLRDSLSSGPATTSFPYGRIDDLPVDACDWSGDGTETPGVVRRDTRNHIWLLRATNSAGPADAAFPYGLDTDTPICGDWNGNGQQTPGIVRLDVHNRFHWHLRNSNSAGPADISFIYGREFNPGTDHRTAVVVGDWDGDGVDTAGIVERRADGRFRWYLRDRHAGGDADRSYIYYGGAVYGDHLATDVPISGDWNDDGSDTAGVVRGSGGSYQWLLRNAHAGGSADVTFFYGRHLDWPIVWK